jgi:hypothetical protein
VFQEKFLAEIELFLKEDPSTPKELLFERGPPYPLSLPAVPWGVFQEKFLAEIELFLKEDPPTPKELLFERGPTYPQGTLFETPPPIDQGTFLERPPHPNAIAGRGVGERAAGGGERGVAKSTRRWRTNRRPALWARTR